MYALQNEYQAAEFTCRILQVTTGNSEVLNKSSACFTTLPQSLTGSFFCSAYTNAVALSLPAYFFLFLLIQLTSF